MPPLLTPIGNEWNPPAAAFGGPPPPGASVGWSEPIGSAYGFVVHENEGSATWGAYNVFINGYAFARVVGYVEGEVLWTAEWEPVAGGDAPVVTPDTNYDASGVKVYMGNEFGPIQVGQGLLTLTATVDGVPSDSIILTVGTDPFYPSISWGPQP